MTQLALAGTEQAQVAGTGRIVVADVPGDQFEMGTPTQESLENPSFTIASDRYVCLTKRMALVGNNRVTLKGTGQVQIFDVATPVLPTYLAPRVVTDSSSPAVIQPNVNTTDVYEVTALANALTINNPIGTPNKSQNLIFRFKDNGTARALTFGNAYRAGTDIAMPTTTVLSKTLYLGFKWNSTDSVYDLIALVNNI
jgi:hypothetical protein